MYGRIIRVLKHLLTMSYGFNVPNRLQTAVGREVKSY